MDKKQSTITPALPKNPLCSVCIANYNGLEYIAECLDSILSQNFGYNIEILVHDDVSTDDSVSYIKEHYPQVKVLESIENVGFCISNNRMVAEAKGKYILLLNNDAALRKNALATLYKASLEYGEGIYGLPQFNAQTGELIDIGSIFDLFFNPIPNTNKKRNDVGMIIGACLWLPKTLWDKIGGFPEWFGSMAEDMYICCVARLWGVPVRALTESGFDHRVGESFGGGKVLQDGGLATTVKRRTLSERNKTFVMIITCPAPAAYLLVPFHLFMLTLEGLLLSLVKMNKSIFLDIYWNCLVQIRDYGEILRKTRKFVQTERRIGSVKFLQPFSLIPYKLKMFIIYGIPYIK